MMLWLECQNHLPYQGSERQVWAKKVGTLRKLGLLTVLDVSRALTTPAPDENARRAWTEVSLELGDRDGIPRSWVVL